MGTKNHSIPTGPRGRPIGGGHHGAKCKHGTHWGPAPKGSDWRMEQSSQWQDRAFENPEPLWNDYLGMFTEMADISPDGEPDVDLPVIQTNPKTLATAPTSGCGHLAGALHRLD